jgi:anti-sigma28 factor (negative regulator of flagellin synthesis)
MNINPIKVDLRRADAAQGVQPTADPTRKPQADAQPSGSAARSDKVQISDAGRALAAQQSDATQETGGSLSSDRVDQIRQRILSGAYNSVDMVNQVAQRILQSGDL